MGNKHTVPTIDILFFALPELVRNEKSVVRYFTSRKLAEAYEDGIKEPGNGSCISEVRLTINLETGKIIGSNKDFDPTPG